MKRVDSNIPTISVTLDTFQLSSGWLKEVASLNISPISVTLDTSQSLARNHIERKFNTKVIVMCGDRWTDVSVSQHPHVSKDLAHLLVWPDKNVPIGVKLPEVD